MNSSASRIMTLFSIAVFSISVAQGHLAVLNGEDTIIRERDAVGPLSVLCDKLSGCVMTRRN